MEAKETKVELSKKMKDVMDTIESMTVMELADLVKALEDKFGVTAQAAFGPMPAAGAAAAGGAAPAVAAAAALLYTAASRRPRGGAADDGRCSRRSRMDLRVRHPRRLSECP